MIDPSIIVLTTAYNCSKYLIKCLDSIKDQSYGNFKCYILNDLSTDNTKDLAEEYARNDRRFIHVENSQKLYQPGNYDQILRRDDTPDEAVVIEVDGDDFLPHENVFSRVLHEHSKGFWITHGSFEYSDGREGFARPFTNNELRVTGTNATHLRTWRAKLWKKIAPEHLRIEGQYAKTAGDVFFMLPMLEMAGEDRIKFIPDILYIYNEENPINDHKVDMTSQFRHADIGRSYPRYQEIK